MVKRINLISCPRNLSTALMYSFANRPDTAVLDEPLYAHYLLKSGADHPGRDEIIQSMENDLKRIIKKTLLGPCASPVLFIKNMAHHFYDIDPDFLFNFVNIIFIRDPKKIIASFDQVIKNPTAKDVGIKKQFELYQYLKARDREAIVLDSGLLLKDPLKVLGELCSRLKIPFFPSMLKWKPGPRPEDGVWAKYWYQNVHLSTGFSRQKTSDRVLPPSLGPLYLQSMNYYNQLFNLAIKA